MTNHLTNQMSSLVSHIKNGNIIGSRWVFHLKSNVDWSIEWYKARLVAKGYSQRPGFKYLEIFTPTNCMSTVRTILALVAIEDLHLQSIDILHTHSNGKMDLDVYMEQPEVLMQGSPNELVCLQYKALYGAKQGSRQWNKQMHKALIEL